MNTDAEQRRAHYLALTCGSQARAVYAAAAVARSVVTVRLLDQGLHNTPNQLRVQLQRQIDEVKPDHVDAILLAYGLCGNGTLALRARETPLVIPRAHDCITLYLGSRQRYQAEIGAYPGTYWCSQDYLERNRQGDEVTLGASASLYQQYVEKYGQDNADYLMEALGAWAAHYQRLVYIETPAPDAAVYRSQAAAKAERRKLRFETLPGNPRLIEALITGHWDNADFLIVPPHHSIERGNDEHIICAAPAAHS